MTPELFLEALEILTNGNASLWLDSSYRFRDMIDRRDEATEEDVEALREALISEFSTKTVERNEQNIQQDIMS